MRLIDFHDKKSIGASTLIVLSIVSLAGTLGVMLLVPKPSLAGLAKKYRDMDFSSRVETQKLRERLAEMRGRSSQLIWNRPPAQVGPAAMAQVSLLAKKHRLNVVAFRPQRATDEGAVGILPMLVSVEGTYPDFAAFVSEVEDPRFKLGVSLMQVTAADGSTNKVNASLGVVALQQTPEVAKAPASSNSKAPAARPATGAQKEDKPNGA